MKEMRVSCGSRSGVIALALRLGNPGRGIRQVYGQWGSGSSPVRAPLGASIPLSRRPRNRMGLYGAARTHPRRQLKRHVHRIRRSSLGWRGIFRAIGAGQTGAAELFCKTHRAWTRNGRFDCSGRRCEQPAIPRVHQSAFRESTLTSRYASPHE